MEIERIVIDPLDKKGEFDVGCFETQQIERSIVDPLDKSVTLEVDMASQREIRFNLVRGAYKLISFHLQDEEDISTVRNIKLTVKESFAKPDADIVFQKDYDPIESNLDEGVIVFKFIPTDTRSLRVATYWYDVQIEVTKEEEIYQVAIGTITLERSIWRRTT